MNRVVGIETEYGCLVGEQLAERGSTEGWPGRVRNYLFKQAKVGALDLHYRDYEEPPGNGGFLLNGGRIYLDMGHLEYASPECRSLRDAVTYDLAGDALLLEAVEGLGLREELSFIKNNVDHHTGATFGCHENYLTRRDLQFTPRVLGTLLGFLATRQIFTGAGRVGQASAMAFDFELPREGQPVEFQLTQRADHIVNDIYQWVQFNRAIINARDEPLADFRRYRRLHLLIGDSNMSPYAAALKLGTTALLLTLLEEGELPPEEVILQDAVIATRHISHAGTPHAQVEGEDGSLRSALAIQEFFHTHAARVLRGRDEETDWLLQQWGETLAALREDPLRLIGGVDWVGKRWLLDTFRESEGLTWQDPWLQSLDLEYHHIDPEKGLFFGLEAQGEIAEFNRTVRRASALREPPADTRAWGRGQAVRGFLAGSDPYVVNWDSVGLENQRFLPMPDPFHTYTEEVAELLE